MNVSPIVNNSIYSFGSNSKTNKHTKNQQQNNGNPISKNGEKAVLAKAAFIGGLGLGAKLLFELMDGDFIFETLGNSAEKIVEKQHKNVNGNKKLLLELGAAAGLIGLFIGGVALLYTLFKAPSINYNGNINAYKKGKDMDVYIKGNETEKELYTQMNDKAKNATEEEKENLRMQYAQMQMAKNKIPDFIKTK